MFDAIPLTPAANALRKSVLKIPSTEKPMKIDLALGLEQQEVEHLHELTVSGDKQAVPALQKALKRFPGNATLLNFLQIAHVIAGRHRQAAAALKELAAFHPNYLFTRLGLAIEALEKNQTEKAIAQLGPDLDIRSLYPQREVFHVSELANYYKLAAMIHARSGQPDLALGLKAAIKQWTDDPQADQVITHEVMRANMASIQTRMKADEKRRIEVRLAPFRKKSVPRPDPGFHHEEILDLYQDGMDLPEKTIRTILALPRQTLLEDLTRVLEDCATHSANFMNGEEADDDFAAFHALHLIAEINGTEALDGLLCFLSLHPDAFEFWLGDAQNYAPQIARIIAGDIPRCAAWLKSPGIHSRHKGILIEAMEQLAKSDKHRLEEVTTALGETLSFVIESPKDANIIDTIFIGHLISALIGLRAAHSLPVIERAYQKDLVELFIVGAFDSLAAEMEEPMRPAEKFLPILKQYAEYGRDMSGPPADSLEDISLPGLPSYDPAPAPETGRNAPCPCGSGKKYKKCCMR